MKIIYMGLSRDGFARSRVHIDGLRLAGAKVFELFDTSTGFSKFQNYRSFLKQHADADVIIIGNPGDILVPFIKILSGKPVIFDAGWFLYESVIISRKYGKIFSFSACKYWFIDFCACLFADSILGESTNQGHFFTRVFFAKKEKCKRLFTGTEENYFFPRPKNNSDVFTVMFRGGYLPEAGIDLILDAAEILKNEKDIRFRILGRGFLFSEIKEKFDSMQLSNVTLEDKKFPDTKDMANEMSKADIALGQLSNHDRLKRAIPHKAFEFTCMGIPYLTARTEAVQEFLDVPGSAVYCNPADAYDLAEKILSLKSDRKQCARIGALGRGVFLKKASTPILGKELLEICREVTGKE